MDSLILIEKVKNLSFLFSLIFIIIFASSCANQQPPGGGDEDKTPPEVKIISPAKNQTNFRGNSIIFEFDEYIDRRSFQDAFRTSPQVKGEIEFNWGAKDVEVVFPKEFYKIDPDKTFVISLNTLLKDIRGNQVTGPLAFAFSTGSKIDKGSVSGKVYGSQGKTASVMAYDLTKNYDPVNELPDYAAETGTDGVYTLTNLAPGRYRMLAVIDDDRNLLFTSERESYGVLPFDIEIQDSAALSNINFNLKFLTTAEQVSPELDVSKYFKDSLNIIYSSIEYNSITVLPDQSIYLFFSRFKPGREYLTSNLKLIDENSTGERIVYSWKNDSLVEIFPQNKFASNRKYTLSLNLNTGKDSVYNYTLPFRTISVNSFGELKGSIISSYSELSLAEYPVKIELTAEKLIPVLRYSFEVRDTVFSFKNLLDASYSLFSFIDKNNNSVYDYGYPFPFEHSEPFMFYPAAINIKGGWTVENVNINFVK